ncbi:MAG: LLM class F420-dependent oxidoreductase [Actinomycetia bacterium]|nr:LLM class F420-dependent oxidoreductase [Actinomycetes bacterium]MCP4960548.1 LLM class F420-dependent oxidoreductase [Actinomycetes bacterium]
MKYGLFGINMGESGEPANLIRVALAAEAAGFESVWTGEHIVLPDPQRPPSPAPPEAPMFDTAVSLAFIASATSTIKLGSGIIILPQRQPAVLAKSLASLDRLSGGRLMFGLGVGYLEPEMTACSTPMARRGRRADEYLSAMRALWSRDAVSFDGEFVRFSSVTANPKPLQENLHTVVGGHSDRALRRAVELGHGWFGFMRDVETAADDISRLRRIETQVERPGWLGRLEVSITPMHKPSPEDIAAYAELGVDRLIVQPGWHRGVDGALALIEELAPSG